MAQGAGADRRARTTSSMALVTPFVFRKYLDYDAYDGPARRPPPDPRAGRAPRLRARRQARRRRHPRDRVHRPGAADRARRARAVAARARHAARARRARRRAASCRVRRSPRLRDAYRYPARRRAPAAVPRRPADADAARRSVGARAARGGDGCPGRSRRSSAISRGVARRRRRTVRRRCWATPPTTCRRARCAVAWEDRAERDRRARRLPTPGIAIPTHCSTRLRATQASPRYLQLPALSRQRFDTLVPQLLAGAARNRERRPRSADRVRAPVRPARGRQPSQRVSGAPDRASAADAAAGEPHGRVRVGGRLPDAPSDPAGRAARRAGAAGGTRLECVARASSHGAAIRGRRPGAADGRAAPLPARADVSPARAGPRRRAHRRAPRRSPVGAGGRRARCDAAAACWQHAARPRSAAAPLRDHRLRQARRQGARLRVRSRPRLPLRRRSGRSRSRRAARALHAPRAAAQHLAHEHDRRRPLYDTDLRLRPDGAKRPPRVEPRGVPALPARERVDLGASGADARALRRRRRGDRRGVRGGARGDPARCRAIRRSSPTTSSTCAAGCTPGIRIRPRCST